MDNIEKSKKPERKIKMSKKSSIFFTLIISLVIVYFYHFLTQGLLVHYGYNIGNLTSLAQPAILVFLFTMTAICLIIVLFGLMLQRPWVKKFIMYFVLWSCVWPIWGLLVGSQSLVQAIMLITFVSIFAYLVSSHLEIHYKRKNVKRFGKITLYKVMSDLKKEFILPISLFTKRHSEKAKVQKAQKTHDPSIVKKGIHQHH